MLFHAVGREGQALWGASKRLTWKVSTLLKFASRGRANEPASFFRLNGNGKAHGARGSRYNPVSASLQPWILNVSWFLPKKILSVLQENCETASIDPPAAVQSAVRQCEINFTRSDCWSTIADL